MVKMDANSIVSYVNGNNLHTSVDTSFHNDKNQLKVDSILFFAKVELENG